VDETSPDVALFTYGTLQLPSVQLDTFGRLLDAEDDVLTGYTIDYLEIDDPHVTGVSGHDVHPILRRTGARLDKVVGKLVRLSEAELEAADEYEVSGYRREHVVLDSGTPAWVYVAQI
jgi:hypothetical protein